MFFINRLRKYIGHTLLRKKYKNTKRNKAVQNLSTANNAILLFQASGIINYNLLFEFEAYLRENNIKTTLMGFVNLKRTPDILLFKKGISLFTKKDLNLWFLPKCSEVDEVLNKHYDLLIDLDTKGTFSLEYIAKLADASFKIGPYNENRNHYDMMLYLDKNNKLNFYIDQLKHYLEKINNDVKAS